MELARAGIIPDIPVYSVNIILKAFLKCYALELNEDSCTVIISFFFLIFVFCQCKIVQI